jgi:hypothetical protein
MWHFRNLAAGLIGRVARVAERLGGTRGEPDLTVDAAKDHGAEVRRQGATIERTRLGR